jgi:hypothetical protein
LSLNLNSSRLIRLLGEVTSVEAEPSRQDMAERLGQWLGAADTVKLHAVLQSIDAVAHEPVVMTAKRINTSAVAVTEVFQQVRAALTEAITADPATSARPPRYNNPLPAEAATAAAPASPEPAATYARFHKRHQDLQRQMELKIAALRARVRQVMSNASPGLKQLAMLDAVMEQTLGAREQRLLAAVPVFLERRFDHWRQAQQPHRFSQEWQAALLAELDLRLQPVMGLMEAFTNEVKKH